MGKVSQKDIANSLNLSRVTITKALQDSPDISKETRLRVKERAALLGYIPDYIGRSLASKRTMTIGVILPKIAHSFFANSVEIFHREAIKLGYNVILMISFEDSEIERKNIETLISMRVDGIIIGVPSNIKNQKNYEVAVNAGIKVLFYDRSFMGTQYATISSGDKNGGYILTKKLIEKGYTKIYHFGGSSYINISAERQRGYEIAMDEHGLMRYSFNVNLDPDIAYEVVMQLAEKKELPEAIFAVTDTVARGIYRAIHELKLNIPKDLALVGYGDIDAAKLFDPPLTTVCIPVKEMAQAAVNIIVQMIEEKNDIDQHLSFVSTFIERASC